MCWPHSTHAHSMVSTAPIDYYSEVIIVPACVFSPWLPGYMDVLQTFLVILTMTVLFFRQTSYVHGLYVLTYVYSFILFIKKTLLKVENNTMLFLNFSFLINILLFSHQYLISEYTHLNFLEKRVSFYIWFILKDEIYLRARY